MGVATAMPTMVADLDGGALYSWPFTAFLVASVAATVLSGRVCDRRGPTWSLLSGPWFFLAGTAAIVASIVAGALAAVVIGVLLARYTERPVVPSAVRQLAIAALAAGVPYAIGSVVGVAVS